MLAHLGLSWFFVPYSQYISVILPVFFFVSGAVAFNSVLNSNNRPYYFINRYISLITPFLIFSVPFLVVNLINTINFNIFEIVKFFIAWPSRGTYPFDMRQLWFINALILMFLISYPIFKYSKSNLSPLILAFTLSILYVPIAEYQSLVGYWRQIDILIKFDLPMQIHQVFSLMNYYFFGALAYQTLFVRKRKPLIVLSAFCFIGALFLHLEIDSFKSMKTFFFERNMYFTLLSYFVIFLLLLLKSYILKFIDKLSFLNWFFMSLSRNSYALFLIHTPIIFLFEKHFGFENLGDQPVLAFVKMAGVVTVSILVAPYLTSFNNKIINLITLKKSFDTNKDTSSHVR